MWCTFTGLDYKNIPEQYLNSNIPEGRGMVKWQPFASMPQQFKTVQQIIENNSKVLPPSHETENRQYIELTLRDNLQASVILRFWQNGFENQWVCQLETIDSDTQIIIVSKDQEWQAIPFDNIYDVTPFGDRYTISEGDDYDVQL